MKTNIVQKPEEVPTPECDKLVAVAGESQKLGEFLDWVLERYTLCDRDGESDFLYPAHININSLLADYFEIDMNKVDAERSALLEAIRESA